MLKVSDINFATPRMRVDYRTHVEGVEFEGIAKWPWMTLDVEADDCAWVGSVGVTRLYHGIGFSVGCQNAPVGQAITPARLWKRVCELYANPSGYVDNDLRLTRLETYTEAAAVLSAFKRDFGKSDDWLYLQAVDMYLPTWAYRKALALPAYRKAKATYARLKKREAPRDDD